MAGDVREWQPIATAPKDGTNILVCREMEDRSVGEAFFWEGAWRTWDGENHTRTSWIEGYLTHWRPMPGAFPAPTNRRIEMARMSKKPTANQPDLTLTVIAERLGCEPDAEAICVAIERLKRKAPSREPISGQNCEK